MNTENHDEISDVNQKHRSRFYELIGHCITSYQTVEDYLPEVFTCSLGIKQEKADAMFSTVRGLETKLALISAALTGAEKTIIAQWDELKTQVAAAAAIRNQIAHGTPITTVVFKAIQGVNGEPGTLIQTDPQRMELHKRNRAGEVRWTVESLLIEAKGCDALFRRLIAFKLSLTGQPVPPHLLME